MDLRYMPGFGNAHVTSAVEGALPARSAAGRALRRGLGWAFFAATAPLFFGGPYPVVVPFEALRAAF